MLQKKDIHNLSFGSSPLQPYEQQINNSFSGNAFLIILFVLMAVAKPNDSANSTDDTEYLGEM